MTHQASPLRIRLARDEDGEALAAIYRPAVLEGATSFEEEAPDGAELARRVQVIAARTPWLVAERGGEVAGYAYAGPYRARAAYRWAVETSAYVAAGHQGAGVGRALYEGLLRLLVRQGFVVAHASIVLPNVASVTLHERVGFVPSHVLRGVGHKQGAWRDVGVWVRELAPRQVPPSEPVALAELPREVLAGELALAASRVSSESLPRP